MPFGRIREVPVSAILTLSHIQFQYPAFRPGQDPVPVLHDLSFSLESGEKVGLIGSNGVGKSTLLKLVVGLLPLQEGTLIVGDQPLTPQNLPVIRRKTGYVFQDSESQLFMPTVESDVSFALRNAGLPAEEVEGRTAAALEKVGMEELAQRQIYRLSGGQKKLTAIAGLLVQDPDLLLMDEPSAALDPRNRRKLTEILRRLPCAQLIAVPAQFPHILVPHPTSAALCPAHCLPRPGLHLGYLRAGDPAVRWLDPGGWPGP